MQQRPVAERRFGEPNSGVDDDFFLVDAVLAGKGSALAEELDDASDELRAVVGSLVGSGCVVGVGVAEAVGFPVHEAQVGAGVGSNADHVRVGEPPGYVIDECRPCLDGFLGDGGAHGVDREHDVVIREGFDDGDHALEFGLFGDANSTGAGGFAADVDDGGSVADHVAGVGNGDVGACEVGGKPLTTVGEGVVGDVKDTHHVCARCIHDVCYGSFRLLCCVCAPTLARLAADEAEYFGAAGGVCLEPSTNRGRGGCRPGFADATHGHAQVFTFDDDDDRLRLEALHHGVRDLLGQAFLHLWSFGVEVNQPGQLREPGDFPRFPRDVPDVGFPVERDQVVFAGRVHGNVPNEHEFAVIFVEGLGENFRRVLVEAGENFFVGSCDALGCVDESFAIGVFPHGD